MMEKEETEKLNNFKNFGAPYLKYLCPDCKTAVEALSIDTMNEIQNSRGIFVKAQKAMMAAKMMKKVQGLICQKCKVKLAKEYQKTQRGEA